MIQFEVTDCRGGRQPVVIVNGRHADLQPGAVTLVSVRPADPPVMSFAGLDGVTPPTAADKFEALLRQVPPMVWGMVWCFILLRLVWISARG